MVPHEQINFRVEWSNFLVSVPYSVMCIWGQLMFDHSIAPSTHTQHCNAVVVVFKLTDA